MNLSLTWHRTAAAPAAACQQAWLKTSRGSRMVLAMGIAPQVCRTHTSAPASAQSVKGLGKGSVATRAKGDVPL